MIQWVLIYCHGDDDGVSFSCASCYVIVVMSDLHLELVLFSLE